MPRQMPQNALLSDGQQPNALLKLPQTRSRVGSKQSGLDWTHFCSRAAHCLRRLALCSSITWKLLSSRHGVQHSMLTCHTLLVSCLSSRLIDRRSPVWSGRVQSSPVQSKPIQSTLVQSTLAESVYTARCRNGSLLDPATACIAQRSDTCLICSATGIDSNKLC